MEVRPANYNIGNVFERRLVEAYISENGKDPVTGEEMTVEDLIDLKTSRTVRPKPPTLTSIPSLLSVFQNEWDALALESYNVRQQLSQTRQELATALYQHDAAIRVIARLTRERDEARDALSKVTIGSVNASNGDQMQVDSVGLPADLADKVDATQERFVIVIFAKLSISNISPAYLKAAESVPYQKTGLHQKILSPTLSPRAQSQFTMEVLV